MGGFQYHDNALAISTHFNITAGHFTVSDFLISSGQDPNGLNKRGDVHTIDTSQKLPQLDFEAGRQKTDAVADFWNSFVAPGQTTVDDSPTQLNFAYTGSLVLQLAIPPITATIDDIALGQGSWANGWPETDENYSNWWFGGKSCSYEGSSEARCAGTDQNGNTLYFHFTRKEKDYMPSNVLYLSDISASAQS